MNDPRDMMAAYAEGTLSAEQVAELEAWLREDPERTKAWVREAMVGCHLDELLREQNLEHVSADASCDASELPPIHLGPSDRLTKQKYVSALTYVLQHTFTPKRLIAGGIAAALLLGAVIAVVLMGGPDSQQQIAVDPGQPEVPIDASTVVATLTAERDAVWDLQPSENLLAGQRFTLTQGFAEITTVSGAVALLQAPATIELVDNDNALRLHAGKLVGICETDSSKGFVVRTPHMDITDLGTKFGVEVTDEQVAATVFAGTIEVTPPGGEPQRLIANQTSRLTVDGNNRELVISDQIAAGFDALREQQSLFNAQLLATGEGLTLDPNWRITAIDGKVLLRPLAMSDPGRAVKALDAFESAKAFLHYPANESADAVYTVETSLRLPANFDPDRQQLALRFRVDNTLQTLKVNGSVVGLPNQEAKDNYLLVHTATIQGPLTPGDNHIALEIKNTANPKSPSNPFGIQVAWELQPIAAKQTEQSP